LPSKSTLSTPIPIQFSKKKKKKNLAEAEAQIEENISFLFLRDPKHRLEIKLTDFISHRYK
jgi:hypothetical protein